MFVDEIKIHLKAGDGGNGVVRWLHLKGKEFSGPAGGNGGKGGDVIVRVVRDRGALKRYVNRKDIDAEKGEDGRSKSQYGKGGEDLFLEMPIGSVITNLDTGKKVELLKEGEEIKILSGGTGGLGNEHFKGSTNINPQESTPGKSGEEAEFLIELELVVDAGLVGLPSAGKSSLLNAVTNAESRVAEYHFTTLEPHLGDLYGFILADIPGLIEGASEGKGLGHKFLRHIKRTKMILHCVSLEEGNVEEDYTVVRGELNNFHESLKGKREVIVLTKTDMVSEGEVLEAEKKMKKYAEDVLSVTILDDESIKKFSDNLVKLLEEEKAI
jgi:GTP-binding protein